VVGVRFVGKGGIVTGGARGIGRAIAERFLREGMRVLVCDRDGPRLAETVRALAPLGEVHGLEGDVASAADVDRLVDRALALWGRIDVLANNAGIATFAPFLEASEADWDRTLAVNLKGMFLVGQRVARAMVRQGGGSIVNMASTNGLVGERGLAAYNASKAGVVLLTKTMAIELAPYGVRVNCVCPGFIDTGLAREAGAGEDFLRTYAQKIPMGRFGRPEEVAAVFAFLASEDASFLTGEAVVVDGGQLAEE
jgi:3-oxoacyl-[acyl-carrier protein] reductase